MKLFRIFLVLLVAMTLTLGPVLAQAAGTQDEMSQGRKIWKTVWRFINFFILAFVIVKFGRKPLMNFLSSHGAEVGGQLDKIKNVLNETETEYRKTEAKLARIEELIAEVKSYMAQDAERLKQKILDDAENNSKHMIREAKEVAESRLKAARDKIKNELVELAMAEAEKIIREHIAAEDQDRLIGDYMGRVAELSPAS
ncbi:MAG: ATP synthase F0 subunit B [Thermodesulfobacteriota bacterium]|nr:ATP synthase F0 subunit B [Thermodesulfobacteriota bacterium]